MGSVVEAESLLLLTSPFSRTVETALGAGAALGILQGDPRLQVRSRWRRRWARPNNRFSGPQISYSALPHDPLLPMHPQLEPALRERCFGDHELTSCASYEVVWAEDAASSANRWGALCVQPRACWWLR